MAERHAKNKANSPRFDRQKHHHHEDKLAKCSDDHLNKTGWFAASMAGGSGLQKRKSNVQTSKSGKSQLFRELTEKYK